MKLLQLFESSFVDNGQSVLKQLAQALEQKQDIDLKIGVEMMPVKYWQVRHLLGKYRAMAKHHGTEEALGFLGNYDAINSALDKMDVKLASYKDLGSVPGERAVDEGIMLVSEDSNPMAQALVNRIMRARLDLLSKYGPEAVLQAVEDVTDGDTEWEEIGTSDVSAYLRYVEDYLVDHHGSREEMDEAEKVAMHRPGWMLRADPKLGEKFKEIERRRRMQAKYAGKTSDEIKKMQDREQGVAEGSEFGAYYHEQLAKKLFDINPDLKDDDSILDAGYKIAVQDLGIKGAQYKFNYDEDFAGDFVSAYASLKKPAMAEGIKTTYQDPLVVVFDRDGLHSHANLSTVNHIFNIDVKADDVHRGPVKIRSGWEDGRDLLIKLSKHHDSAMAKDAEPVAEDESTGKHIVLVTVTDPNHPAVSQRKEKFQRRAKVSARDRQSAITAAINFYKRQGLKVWDDHYVGLADQVNESHGLKKKSKALTEGLARHQAILVETCQGLTVEQCRVVEGINRELRPLIEATLAPEKIDQLFGNIEQTATASGGNRTLIGKGVDTTRAVNQAINNAGKWLQNTAPVKAFDQKFEQLKTTIGGKFPELDKKLTELGSWAKENPGKTAAVIGVLTTIAALAGGPVGGAIAGQILRGTTELIKGEKLSTAVGKGVKTAAVGALAGWGLDKIGDMLGSGLRMVADNLFPGAQRLNLSFMATGTGPETFQNLTDVVGRPEDLAPIRAAWNQASEAWRNGQYEAAENLFLQAKAAAQDLTDPTLMRELAASQEVRAQILAGAKSVMTAADALAAAAQGAASGAGEGGLKGKTAESRQLTAQEVDLVMEGVWDTIKGLGSKVAQKVGDIGHNITTKTTANKLRSAWQSAGSPTDSAEIYSLLQKQGVDPQIINQTFKSMKIPVPKATRAPASTAAPVSTTPAPSAAPAASAPKFRSRTAGGLSAYGTADAGTPAVAPAPEPQAEPATAKKHTGGKVTGQVSMTPNAIRKRDARAAAKTGATTAPGAFGRMVSQLTQPTSKSSTGGTTQATAQGVIHRAAASNPNQPTPAAVPAAKAAAVKGAAKKIAQTQQPVSLGGQKLDLTDPKNAAIAKQLKAQGEIAEADRDRELRDKIETLNKGRLKEGEKKPKPTNPQLWGRAKSAAKSKFDVYPSAYANAWAAKWYKQHGGGWR